MRALAYYFTTTCCAVVIGICCVLTIHPGDPAIKGKLGAGEEDHRVLTIDAFLDLIRSVSGAQRQMNWDGYELYRRRGFESVRDQALYLSPDSLPKSPNARRLKYLSLIHI